MTYNDTMLYTLYNNLNYHEWTMDSLLSPNYYEQIIENPHIFKIKKVQIIFGIMKKNKSYL